MVHIVHVFFIHFFLSCTFAMLNYIENMGREMKNVVAICQAKATLMCILWLISGCVIHPNLLKKKHLGENCNVS